MVDKKFILSFLAIFIWGSKLSALVNHTFIQNGHLFFFSSCCYRLHCRRIALSYHVVRDNFKLKGGGTLQRERQLFDIWICNIYRGPRLVSLLFVTNSVEKYRTANGTGFIPFY